MCRNTFDTFDTDTFDTLTPAIGFISQARMHISELRNYAKKWKLICPIASFLIFFLYFCGKINRKA